MTSGQIVGKMDTQKKLNVPLEESFAPLPDLLEPLFAALHASCDHFTAAAGGKQSAKIEGLFEKTQKPRTGEIGEADELRLKRLFLAEIFTASLLGEKAADVGV